LVENKGPLFEPIQKIFHIVLYFIIYIALAYKMLRKLEQMMTPSAKESEGEEFFAFSAKNLEGTETINLANYKGKICIVVNVASF